MRALLPEAEYNAQARALILRGREGRRKQRRLPGAAPLRPCNRNKNQALGKGRAFFHDTRCIHTPRQAAHGLQAHAETRLFLMLDSLLSVFTLMSGSNAAGSPLIYVRHRGSEKP